VKAGGTTDAIQMQLDPQHVMQSWPRRHGSSLCGLLRLAFSAALLFIFSRGAREELAAFHNAEQ
jgi:hypothetical protein